MATSMTLGQIIEPAEQGQALPLQHGVQLAQAQQDMQQKQAETQVLRQQLDDAKWNSFKNLMDTYTRAAPTVQKAMKNQVGGRFKSIGADPAILEIVGDQDQANNWRRISGAFGTDPEAKAQGLQAMTNVAAFSTVADHAIQSLDKTQQAEWNAKAAAAKNQSNIVIQTGHDEARKEAAQIQTSGSARMINSQTQANNSYSREIGPSENAIMQANRAEGIISKIQSGSLKSTKTLAADLDAAQASLLGGGKPSTVYGQQAVHMDDIYSRAANAIQFISAEPQNSQSPAKLAQLKLDVEALRDFYNEQHQQKYSSFREGLADQVQGKLDSRFQTFRKNQGMDTSFASSPVQQQASGTTAVTSGAAGLTQNQQNYVKTAQSLVNPATKQPYSMDEIMQRMKAKKIP